MKRIILLALTFFLISLNSFSSINFGYQKTSNDFLKYNPKFGISIMPIQYFFRMPNINTEFQMNRILAFNLGYQYKVQKDVSSYYGYRLNLGTTLGIPVSKYISFQMQCMYLYGKISDMVPLSNAPYERMNFSIYGVSTGIGLMYSPIENLFMKMQFVYQYFPYEQITSNITNRETDYYKKVSSWELPFELVSNFDFQLSIGYRFGLKKE